MKNKLWAVIRHEYLTIVKQPAFLLSLLFLPAVIAAVMGLGYFADRTAEANIDEAAKQAEHVIVIDESGLLHQDVVQAFGLEQRPPGRCPKHHC